MNKQAPLQGKTIVITGASSGAGRAAALAFAPHKCWLVLSGRNEAALNEAAAECRELGSEVLVVPADVTEPGALPMLANAANDWNGVIDIWINNAGVLAAGPFDKTPMEVHRRVIETNLLGYMNGVHAVLPFFKQQGYGTIINNISIGGYLPVPYGAGYTASKFGLRGFSESVKAELTTFPDIHICDLFPAFLDTPGILHAGNFTGKVLKPAPPVYDPNRLAQEMVQVAISPRANTYVGSASVVLKLMHALFPELTVKITGMVMRGYFRQAVVTPHSDGNLFNSVDYGMSTHGGFGIPGKPRQHRKYILGALAAGVVIGLVLKGSGKKNNNSQK